jgi:hypothetical protein
LIVDVRYNSVSLSPLAQPQAKFVCDWSGKISNGRKIQMQQEDNSTLLKAFGIAMEEIARTKIKTQKMRGGAMRRPSSFGFNVLSKTYNAIASRVYGFRQAYASYSRLSANLCFHLGRQI